MSNIDMRKFYKIIFARMMNHVAEEYESKLKQLEVEATAVEKMMELLNQSKLPENFADKMVEYEKKIIKIEDKREIASIPSGGRYGRLGHVMEGHDIKSVLQGIKERNEEKQQCLRAKKEQIQNNFISAIGVSGKPTKPLTSISAFFKFLRNDCKCDDSVTGRAIGLAIKYNVEYNRNHPDEEMADIEILRQLAQYINPFGSRSTTTEEDKKKFEELLSILLDGSKSISEELSKISKAMATNKDSDNDYVVPEKEKPSAPVVPLQKAPPVSEPLTSGEVAFRALLRSVCKNGEVLGLPDCVLVDFFEMANRYLEKNEAEYIIGKIKPKLISPILMYIKPADREVVIGANAAKSYLTEEQIPDYNSLMNDLSALASIAKEANTEDDKQYFDEELRNALGNLKLLFEKQGIILGESVSKHSSKLRERKRKQQPKNKGK